MALKDTIHTMKKIIGELHHDLEKATDGNKAASQRVRTGSIKLAKIAKLFRKESVAAEKKGGGKKKSAPKAKIGGKKSSHAKRATAKLPSKKRK